MTARQIAMHAKFALVCHTAPTSLVRISSVAGEAKFDHQRQINELLDRAAPKLRPDQFVLALYLLICRMRRPVDAEMTLQVVETDRNGAVAPIESRVHINAQARDGRSFDSVSATP